jgi:two-component sensor histidine kinase
VKNTLATVQAVVNATARSSLTVNEFTQAFTGRIGHGELRRHHDLRSVQGQTPPFVVGVELGPQQTLAQAASFEGLLRAELNPYDERGRLTLDGPKIVMPSERADPARERLGELVDSQRGTRRCIHHGLDGGQRVG